jgi:hypothetical protein
MYRSGIYPFRLQNLILEAYKGLGFGDESLGERLAAADMSGACIGSGKLVEKWRNARSGSMPIGALSVLLDHVTERQPDGTMRTAEAAGPILQAVCDVYGFVAIRRPNVREQVIDFGRGAVKAACTLGRFLDELEGALEDGVVTPDEAQRALAQLDPHIEHATAMREKLAGIARQVR